MNRKILLSCLCLAILCTLPAIQSMAQSPVTFGSGNLNGATITSSHNAGNGSPEETLDGDGFLPNEVATSRFLAQTTLGADIETIMASSNLTFEDWITTQFDAPRLFYIEQRTKDITVDALDSTLAQGGNANYIYPRLWFWHSAWWDYTMMSQDLLRNRVSLALSEIFVISEVPQLRDAPLGLASYYDMLLDNAFGNFRELLEKVTLHPCMGLYLTHINNPKSDTALNRFPDENYAREVMQLFTLGLYELNLDGTRKLDSAGHFIPTYDNADIGEFAKVFTGLSYGDTYLFGQSPQSQQSYTYPMKMFNSWHEPGPKYLLNGFVVPNRSPVNGMADIEDALDNLFNHPNVGPFFSRLLIQRLITSNPTPAYVARVATVFNNNGQGVRGDMKAVIRAILLDEEARDCGYIDSPYRGMLREPMVRYTHVSRAFNAFSQKGIFRNAMEEFYLDLFQRPLASPSVFNFFLPDYQPIGPIDSAGLVAPEFQITNAVSIAGYANQLYKWIMRDNQVMEVWSNFENEYWADKAVNLNLTDEMAFDGINEIGQLLERLNLILLHGQMSPTTRQIIRGTLEQVPQDHWEERVRMGIYLSMISPDYLIFR
ncbi:MAG: hypothetical protein RI973_11 [Bacteroidota bacterium]|jgi:uncharacterized protein (DUF1800 family)